MICTGYGEIRYKGLAGFPFVVFLQRFSGIPERIDFKTLNAAEDYVSNIFDHDNGHVRCYYKSADILYVIDQKATSIIKRVENRFSRFGTRFTYSTGAVEEYRFESADEARRCQLHFDETDAACYSSIDVLDFADNPAGKIISRITMADIMNMLRYGVSQ